MPNVNVSIFSQILQLIDRSVTGKLIQQHNSDKHAKGIGTWTHLVSMVFCHLANASSLREIAFGLKSAAGNIVHLGASKAPSKSSLSYLNKTRGWEVFQDIYFGLLEKLEPSLHRRRQYAARLKRKIYLMDATIITLCTTIFDWARFRQTKGAIKLHTVLDYDTFLPVFMHMTDGKKHEIEVARKLTFPPGSVVVMDRAYIDFSFLHNLDSMGVYFVTRIKDNILYQVADSYLTNEKHEHILSDEDIELLGDEARSQYQEKLRIVKVYDKEQDRFIIVLTNNFSWTADTISQLYQARWDIEVFFKAIKQTLRIKTFVGTTPNAVLIQIWTAMITILLLKYLQQNAKYGWHLSNLVASIRLNLFVKMNLFKWINNPFIN